MSTEIRIMINDEQWSYKSNEFYQNVSALDYVPSKGDEILYRNFRSNKSMDKEIIDYLLLVEKISYETEESWNKSYSNKVVKVHVSIISQTKLQP